MTRKNHESILEYCEATNSYEYILKEILSFLSEDDLKEFVEWFNRLHTDTVYYGIREVA